MTAALLSILAMTAIVAVRYLAVSGAFAWATRKVRPGLYSGRERQIRREIGWSLASALVYGVPAGIVAWGWAERGWTRIYSEWDAWPLWYAPLAPLIYLVLHDAWFYWTHRLFHRPWWFARVHAVHHMSRPPTAWAAMSFSALEALSGAVVVPALVFAIPIHAALLLAVLAVMTVMGVTNHMGWELFPRPVRGWLISASHHQLHHERYGANFGLYFRAWDRLCGTDRGLADLRAAGRHDAAAEIGPNPSARLNG